MNRIICVNILFHLSGIKRNNLSGIFNLLVVVTAFSNPNKKTPFPELWPEKAFYELLKIVKLKVSLDVIWLARDMPYPYSLQFI